MLDTPPDGSAALGPEADALIGASAKTLVGAAYHNLRRDIIEGRLAPGSRLRVEHLKDSYGVGAGTLREALALLVSDALVIAQDQRGFHVKPISIADFNDITQTRILLECEALRQSIQHGDDVWEGRIVAAFHRLDLAEKRLSSSPAERFDEWEHRNREYHQALISACTSPWVRHFLSILYQQAERYRRLVVTHKPIPRNVHGEHQAILDAALARDTVRACSILTEHIGLTFEAVKHLPETLFNH